MEINVECLNCQQKSIQIQMLCSESSAVVSAIWLSINIKIYPQPGLQSNCVYFLVSRVKKMFLIHISKGSFSFNYKKKFFQILQKHYNLH